MVHDSKRRHTEGFFHLGGFYNDIFYVLTKKRKVSPKQTLYAIDLMSREITPCYIKHSDYTIAKCNLFDNILDDLKDLIVLNSASERGCSIFVTNDKKLLGLAKYKTMKITKPEI